MKKLLLIALLIVGCAMLSNSNTTKFFGIAINDLTKYPNRMKEFVITSYSDSSGVGYNLTSNIMNDDITAWCDYHGIGINIRIINGTKAPLFSNYFLDEFLITDKSGNVYTLTKQSITSYPSGDIYPGYSADFMFLELPIDREEIIMIWVNLGGRNSYGRPNYRINILLKRLPKPE